MTGPVLYELTIPVYRKALQNLIALLKTAEGWCHEQGHDVSIISKARLADDMFALPFHVQFSAHNATQLFTELEVLDFEGVDIDGAETPVDQLIAQLQQTLATLERVTSESLIGLEDTTVTMSFGSHTLDKRAIDSVQLISMPSFWFHASMVYAIVRSLGVPMNKQKHLNSF